MERLTDERLHEVLGGLKSICEELTNSLTPRIAERIAGARGLGIFECEDYKCDKSFKCTDYKCSGGGFKCNDVFKISAEMAREVERGGSGGGSEGVSRA
jgi:hypothetical protein